MRKDSKEEEIKDKWKGRENNQGRMNIDERHQGTKDRKKA